MKKNTDFSDNLKHSGLKNTKQRTAILDILDKSNQPIAAEDVYIELKENDISINLSTVYRTLETLNDKNLVTKLSIVGDSRSFLNVTEWYISTIWSVWDAKKIVAINYCPLGVYQEALEQETHFKISGHKLDIYGFCPQCQEKGQQKEMM